MEAAGRTLPDEADAFDRQGLVQAAGNFTRAIQDLGGASVGDKTLLDALVPFTDELRSSLQQATGPLGAWRAAVETATRQAAATAELTPKVGRARPLAEKSLGTPDAGATSMALILTALGQDAEVFTNHAVKE